MVKRNWDHPGPKPERLSSRLTKSNIESQMSFTENLKYELLYDYEV